MRGRLPLYVLALGIILFAFSACAPPVTPQPTETPTLEAPPTATTEPTPSPTATTEAAPTPTSTATAEATATPTATAEAVPTATPDATPEDEASPTPDTEFIAGGETLYLTYCANCHGAGGQGAGRFPALDGHPLVTAEDPSGAIEQVVYGGGGMPAYQNELDDEEIAAILSYIRQAWSNDAPPVTPEQVEDLR